MLVVEKTHRIRVKITGPGAKKVAAALTHAYPDARVFAERETESLRGSHWFEQLEADLTAGRALRVYCDNAGLTLAALSEKTGIPVPHLSAMDHDKRPIGGMLAHRLGEALKCDYRRFLTVARGSHNARK